jgi:hypothetical protein
MLPRLVRRQLACVARGGRGLRLALGRARQVVVSRRVLVWERGDWTWGRRQRRANGDTPSKHSHVITPVNLLYKNYIEDS